MDPEFKTHMDSLNPSLVKLREMQPVVISELPKGKLSGIYLFSEGDKHLYVGRTRNLKATYTKAGSRKELMKDPR